MTLYNDWRLQQQITTHLTSHPESFVTGSGVFSGDAGTVITHNTGTIDHFCFVTPAGIDEFSLETISTIGTIYVKYGTLQDTVYNTGGPTSSGLEFVWGVTASGMSEYSMIAACAQCIGGVLEIDGDLTASSGTFTEGITIGSDSVHINSEGITLPNSPALTSLDRFYKNMVGGRLEKYSDTELRWQEDTSDTIGLWNGNGWELVCPSGTIQAFSDSTTISGGALTYDTNYDVYATYESADNFTLEFQEWAGATSRYEEPTRWQGIYVRDLTDEGKKKRWLGIVRLRDDSGAKFTDSATQRFISNFYNQKDLYSTENLTATNWSYSSDTWRPANNDTSCKLEYVLCNVQQITLGGKHNWAYSSVSSSPEGGISIDSTTSVVKNFEYCGYNTTQQKGVPQCIAFTTPNPGYHYSHLLERSTVNGQSVDYSSYNRAYVWAKFKG